MPNRGYEKGRRAEWKVKRLLEAEGWFVVRAAGSRGPVDLVAIRPPDRDREWMLVQVKASARKPQPAPVAGEEDRWYRVDTAWVHDGKVEWL